MHDVVLVNPDLGKLQAEVFVMIEDANKRCKVRTIKPPGNEFWQGKFLEPEGILQMHGGIPPEFSKSGTTRLVLIWWTDHQGRRHVRLKLGRDKSAVSKWFIPPLPGVYEQKNYFLWIYPDAHFKNENGKILVRCVRCGRCGAEKHLQPTELDCGICRDMEEYTKSGLLPAVGKQCFKSMT